jgi:hypothetical protein
MKLSLEKLGRIERAEIEVRPLTVLVGANNTNKTWAAYALYGLLRYLTWRKPAVAGVRSYGTSLMKIQTPAVRKRVLAAAAEAIDRMPKGEADTAVLHISRQSLLGGAVHFQQRASGYRLAFQPRGGPALPMHATSSIVRSLSSLNLYLRYTAREGDTLIIDEPEMNAHPDAQIGLTQLLAYLVNRGIRVVLTTHSPYILDHLNNLIAARRCSPGDQQTAAMESALGSRECFLSGEKVAAYLFETENEQAPVRVKPIYRSDDPAALFDWDTFMKAPRFLGYFYALDS